MPKKNAKKSVKAKKKAVKGKAVKKVSKKKTIKKKAAKPKYVKICPECKSVDVYQDKSTMQQLGALPTMYICRNCGHSGVGFPEVAISELEAFEKKIDEKHLRDVDDDRTELVDTRYGKFAVHFLWKITAPITILLGILLLFLNTTVGVIVLLLGLVMFYITYFVKRKLRDKI